MIGLTTSQHILLNFLTVATMSVVGLIAVWAALGRRPHWAVRCGVLLGVIFLCFLIPAYELVAMYLAQSILVVVALFVWRAFEKQPDGSRPGLQYSLRDILFLTLLTAVVMAAGCSVKSGSWTIDKTGFHLAAGALLGLTTIIACGVVFSRKWLWRSLWLVACGIGDLVYWGRGIGVSLR